MSDVSRFLKRQEKNVRGMYDKNLGQFVEEWKRPLLIGGAAALTGGLGGAALSGGTMAGLGTGAMLGGAAGAAAGYQRTKSQKAKWAAAEDRRRQELAQRLAGDELTGIIDPYLPPEDGVPSEPTPYEPPGGPIMRPPVEPGQPPIAPPEPAIDLVSGQPTLDTSIPGVDPTMGNIDVSGPAGQSAGTILDETERARQMQIDLLNQQSGMKDKARSEMAELLNQQMERQYSDQMPAYLEDLNTRGLLRSSALGDRLAKERARMSAGVNEQLGLQGIQDKYGSIEGLGGIQDQYLQGRQSALGRKFSLEDYAQQIKASQLLGQAAAPIQPYTGGGKSGAAQAGMAGAGLGLSAAGAGK